MLEPGGEVSRLGPQAGAEHFPVIRILCLAKARQVEVRLINGQLLDRGAKRIHVQMEDSATHRRGNCHNRPEYRSAALVGAAICESRQLRLTTGTDLANRIL